ncbi:telethonin-like [Polyodon spathula]|uniref:telethonin-like n=1 Tax=Polyodon spathula TaxID=7913 RepID=UPI001B7DF1B5|nr:telethonin-like [Polyodon spathula]
MHSSASAGPSHLFNAHCEVKEDNLKDKESYHSKRHDLDMETRPRERYVKRPSSIVCLAIFTHRTTLSDNNTQKKESYEKKHLDDLVQRSPDQKMKIGRLGEGVTEYQLPYRNILPVPIFVPNKVLSVVKDSERAPTPVELKAIMEFEKALSSGVSVGWREISEITKEMPNVFQPIRMDFRASNLVLPRNVLP